MINKISKLFLIICCFTVTPLFAKTNAKKLESTIIKNEHKLQQCRNEANTNTFMVSGKVVVDLEINDTAQIQRIKINDEKTTLKDLNLQMCVVNVFKKIKYPKAPKSQIISISHPVIFK